MSYFKAKMHPISLTGFKGSYLEGKGKDGKRKGKGRWRKNGGGSVRHRFWGMDAPEF